MQKSVTRRERRANRRILAATLRRRTAATRLTASCRRRPRSLTTHLIAAGVDRTTASGCASGLRTAAKRAGITPALTTRTRRTVHGGRARTRLVHRFTRAQAVQAATVYRPRKAEYKAAVARLTGSAL